MSVLARVFEFDRIREDSFVVKAFRSQNFALNVAVLAEYFSSGQARIDSAEFHERLAADLEEIAAEPHLEYLVTANKSAVEICRGWIEARLLARRQDIETKSEYYELTSVGQTVISSVSALRTPRAATTQSRLALLIDQLSDLEQATNENQGQRLEYLQAQKERIEHEIERVQAGEIKTLDRDRALEGLRDLVDLARQVPGDFARVRESFHRIAERVRLQLLDSEVPQEETLDAVFTGLDHVKQSDEGKSFNAFFALLTDPERRAIFDAAISGLDERGLLDELEFEDQMMLRTYMKLLRDESQPVRQMMQVLSANLRDFVKSRQFREYRAMADKLREIQALGLRASRILGPTSGLSLEVAATSYASSSVGRIALRVPANERIETPIDEGAVTEVDWEELRRRVRESEIDLEQLTADINAVVANGPASISQVLAQCPAQQGLASVVGLLMLGMRHGKAQGQQYETVTWHGMFDKVERSGEIPLYIFERAIDE